MTDDIQDQFTQANQAASEPATQTPEADNDPMVKQLDELQKQSTEHHQNYLRTYADYENYRKRAQKEKEDLRKSMTSNFMSDLIPVLDSLQLGLNAAETSTDVKNMLQGFKMVVNQFESLLKSNKVESIDPVGKEFNPNLHDCISHVVSETVPENHVIQTIRLGYKLEERLIRPANVIVSSGTKSSEVDIEEAHEIPFSIN